MLSTAEVTSLSQAVDLLEEHALARIQDPPRHTSPRFKEADYHRDPDGGYHAIGSRGPGQTLMVEDFFNADRAFDMLVNHERTMEYIRDIVAGPIRINNSELRIRYTGNSTPAHFGGPTSPKYRYSFNQGRIDAMMVRAVYFLHDVSDEQGPFSLVPGTHKSNYPSPYMKTFSVDDEPGMIGIEVNAGDCLIFTENLRHGGLTNYSEQTRKTLHVGYGPYWMNSQNIATMDDPQYILPQTLERYDDGQRALFVIDHEAVNRDAAKAVHHVSDDDE
jgi:hypothetical protein